MAACNRSVRCVGWRRALLTLPPLALLSVTALFLLPYPICIRRPLPLPPLIATLNQSTPIVMAWTPFFSSHLDVILKQQSDQADCPYKCTYINRNSSLLYSAHALIFHTRNIDLCDVPTKHIDQVYLLYNMESPFNTGNEASRLPTDYFDGLMSYESSSTFPVYYDTFLPTNATDEMWTQEEVERIVAGKTRGSLIFVSNCHSRSGRETIIREMSKGMEVTVVGECSRYLSTHDDSHCTDSACEERLIASHHFYLAFENSICNDYITEKFWRVKKLIVPIVLRRAAYSTLPQSSFIAVDDFSSVRALLSHLDYLTRNHTAYLEHFSWTRYFSRHHTPASRDDSACALCRYLHTGRRSVISNGKREISGRLAVRSDASDHWIDTRKCEDLPEQYMQYS